MVRCSAVVALALAVLSGESLGEAAPQIPSSELPGRERERFLDRPSPPVPRIELQDGQPKPVITQPKQKKPIKRKTIGKSRSKAR